MDEQKIILPFKSRTLKNGEYVIVGKDAEPLIVNASFIEQLSSPDFSVSMLDDKVIEMLSTSGYIGSSKKVIIPVPDEGHFVFLKIGRIVCLLFGFISLIFNLYSIGAYHGVKSGNDLIHLNISGWELFFSAILIALGTSLVHEIFHLIFSRNIKDFRGKVHLHLFKATATVSMSHIWAWSAFSRFMAISAGMIADSIFLSITILVGIFSPLWIFSIANAVLWIRILWQFRFYSNCDGRILLQSFFDNPSFGEKNFIGSVRDKIWNLFFNFMGLIVLVLILYLWGYPFFMNFLHIYF